MLDEAPWSRTQHSGQAQLLHIPAHQVMVKGAPRPTGVLIWGDSDEQQAPAGTHPATPVPSLKLRKDERPSRARAAGTQPPTWGVDDEQSWEAQVLQLPRLPQGAGALGQGVIRNVGRSDLLRDAACLSVLDICAPHIVQDLGFACRGSMGRVEVCQEGVGRSGGCEHVHRVPFGAELSTDAE